MPEIKQNIDLKDLNTFGISAKAKLFAEINGEDDINELLNTVLMTENKVLILGGGSNILFTKDFDGLVLRTNIKGFKDVGQDDDHILIRSGAGEKWHDLVMHTVDRGLSGLENLSLIPGSVGAAPVQNIGAYGVELKDVFVSLEAVDLQSGDIKVFKSEDCRFGYRDSLFKNEAKGRYLISHITIRLNKSPSFNLSYGNIIDTLKEMHVESPTVKDVSDAVISIRRSKLPDPAIIGNAGSFFKNPLVSSETFHEIQSVFPDCPGHQSGGLYKIPAAWLIDQCGWKGKKRGEIGVHVNQPLVLVNYGGGRGKEIERLALEILDSVKNRFNIGLIPEVNIL